MSPVDPRPPFALGVLATRNQQDKTWRSALLGDPCSYCGASAPSGHADHIVPRAQTRELGWENLTAACPRCNTRKGTHTLLAVLSGLPVRVESEALSKRFNLPISPALLAEIDAAKSDYQPVASWIREAIELRLDAEEQPAA